MPRRSKVDTSEHKDEIALLLIDYRWSSRAVARYLELKYGEIIPGSTLRTWRLRRVKHLEKVGKLPEIWNDPDPDDMSAGARARRLALGTDEIPDVMSRRLALIKMQEERIQLDLQHEIAMGKLFSSQRHEVELLNKLYDSMKEDLQDLGVLPSPDRGANTQVNVMQQAVASGGGEPKVDSGVSIGELLPGAEREEVRQFARALTVASRTEDE